MSLIKTKDGKSYLLPFVLITTLFFLWAFAHGFLEVLNPHFQQTLNLSKTESAMVQFVVYVGYFLMAIPAGKIISKFGYRTGVIVGLLLYGIGSLLFIPGAQIHAFWFFLLCLFIIGCGVTCLETAANPYVTVLGDPDSAERRINLSQSLNGLGWIVGPFVGGMVLFDESSSSNPSAISIPYAVVGVIVIIIAFIFFKVKLPEINEANSESDEQATDKTASLWSHKNFVFGLLALFLYVAAQTGINSFFVNYAHENANLDQLTASRILSFVCMGLFMVGRMCGSFVMSKMRAELLLGLCAIGAAISMVVILLASGTVGLSALFVCYLCESIMFPTIFALAIRGVGAHTKQASSYLIMSIVGGAIAPMLMGYIADSTGNMQPAFSIPLVCYIVIMIFSFWVVKTHKKA